MTPFIFKQKFVCFYILLTEFQISKLFALNWKNVKEARCRLGVLFGEFDGFFRKETVVSSTIMGLNPIDMNNWSTLQDKYREFS